MIKFLLNTTISYRVPTVEAALLLRDELQKQKWGELVNFSYKTKELKKGGEVEEEYVVVKATFNINNEKDPEYSAVDFSIGIPEKKEEDTDD